MEIKWQDMVRNTAVAEVTVLPHVSGIINIRLRALFAWSRGETWGAGTVP